MAENGNENSAGPAVQRQYAETGRAGQLALARAEGLGERDAALAIEAAVRGSVEEACKALAIPEEVGTELLSSSEQFQRAVLTVVQQQRASDLLLARHTILKLAKDGSSDAVRFKAAQLLLEHAIGKPIERHLHAVEHQIKTPVEFIAVAQRIRALSQELGLAMPAGLPDTPNAKVHQTVELTPGEYTPVLPQDRPSGRKRARKKAE